MSLPNRVDPFGEIHAVAARGTMMGNRGGKFHRPDRTLGRRRWASHHWICCELNYKDMHHEPMGQGYTSLFFLDEVTALAAGHRPCFFCRRQEASAFLGQRRADDFDRLLHAQRTGPRPAIPLGGLPEGAMVESGGAAFAVKSGRLLPWSFAGYGPGLAIPPGGTARLLTPPAIIAILAAGLKPRWHESATKGDGI